MTESKKTSRCGCVFVKQFKHWRSGEIIRAEDYGYEAFCFRRCPKHRA